MSGLRDRLDASGALPDEVFVRRREVSTVDLAVESAPAAASPAPSEPDLPELGSMLDRYRIEDVIGRGAFDDACREGQALAEAARRSGWAVQPEALRLLGLAQLKLGRLLESEAMLTLAQASASRLDSLGISSGGPTLEARRTAARCEVLRGTVLRIRGTLDEALAAFDAARVQFEALDDTVGQADALSELGHARLTLAGELDAAEALIERAKGLYEALGNQVGVATCVNTLGDIHRRRGDWAAAEQAYRWAMVRFDRSGSDARLFPRLNLGLVLLHVGAVDDADALFAEAQVLIDRSRRAGLSAVVRICRLPGAAARRDAATWAEGIEALARHGDRPDADLAGVCARAAELAAGWDPVRASVAAAAARALTPT